MDSVAIEKLPSTLLNVSQIAPLYTLWMSAKTRTDLTTLSRIVSTTNYNYLVILPCIEAVLLCCKCQAYWPLGGRPTANRKWVAHVDVQSSSISIHHLYVEPYSLVAAFKKSTTHTNIYQGPWHLYWNNPAQTLWWVGCGRQLAATKKYIRKDACTGRSSLFICGRKVNTTIVMLTLPSKVHIERSQIVFKLNNSMHRIAVIPHAGCLLG